ncbi:uncharacterized protein PADG_01102 [Paracoccidioides brasiliensis Pb18]|uniref:Uncharacterized protein n=1 Tax=Paracoccidioides brasiliensis (strain Pb18) TaxID=502780 RepID=C1FZ76_PARBD|nr:uncharacterized protein PADG_01102 [Paracoccidioides brasiliensis Pb18]EEH44813.1 hypothetical protein PADG_01102 [Paracoccidioides brasiliensis Pb18]ODH47547.1 hypothetical protein GX48_06353 [Paracoccidioides brasiliensis]
MNDYPGPRSSAKPGDVEPIPYMPVPSMARELGIMFGFIALSLVTMLLYSYFWQAAQKRINAKEANRREALAVQERLRRAEKEQQQGLEGGDGYDEIGRGTELSVSGAVGERPDRSTRNGTSENGFGFGDTTEGLIV